WWSELLTSNPGEGMVDSDISGMSAPAPPGWDIGAAPARFLSTSAQLTAKLFSSQSATYQGLPRSFPSSVVAYAGGPGGWRSACPGTGESVPRTDRPGASRVVAPATPPAASPAAVPATPPAAPPLVGRAGPPDVPQA